MKDNLLSPSRLNEIVQGTINSIEKSKKQIFDIAEEAKNELKDLDMKLMQLKEKVKSTIDEVEQYEILEKESRRKLMLVSRNFKHYTESDIKKAYETTQDLQVKLAVKRDQEQQLISQRTDLEVRIRKVRVTLERAEELTNHVAVAMSYLQNALMNIGETLEELQNKELLGAKIIMAQEEERQRVARDIHDGPAQSLSNIVLKCDICDRMMDVDLSKAREELKDLKQLVRTSLQEIRKIIFDLRPMSLDDLGLIPTLQRYISNYKEETSIDVASDFYRTDEKVDSIVEVAVFRVVQEALNNIRKYAEAKQALVQIKIRDGFLHGAVIDTGIGFDADDLLNNRGKKGEQDGFGLYGMKRRIELLKGQLDISSQIGKGTAVRWKIPLYHMEKEDTNEQNKSNGGR